MNSVHEEIVWSKGKAKSELAKQTTWSSSKDWSGLSGLKILCLGIVLMLVLLQLLVKE